MAASPDLGRGGVSATRRDGSPPGSQADLKASARAAATLTPPPPGVVPVAGTTAAAGGAVLPLYTPAEAARLLAVRESWLRRRATARAVP